MTGAEFLAAYILWSGPGYVGAILMFVARRMMDVALKREFTYLTPLLILIWFVIATLAGPLILLTGVIVLVIGFVMLVLSPDWWTKPIFGRR